MGQTGALVYKSLFCIDRGRQGKISALFLKLAQAFPYVFPFKRLCLLFLGEFLFFRPLPCSKVTVILLHNCLRFAVGWQAVVSTSEGPYPANAVYCTKRATIRFHIKLECSVKSIAPINALFFPFNLSNNPILYILK